MHADPNDALVNATAAKGRVGLRPSYFWRHWRGELTLATSYWVNDVLVSVLAGIAVLVLTAIVAAKIIAAPRLVSFGLAAIQVTAILLSVWQLVGTWRCARRVRAERRRAGKRAVRTYVVQALMILGLVEVSWVTVIQTLPAATGLLSITLRGDSLPQHTLRVVNAGTEILVGGGIDFGTAADLQRLLEATPGIRTLDFNSAGGRLAEANAMAAMIRNRHLATYTNALCASACTIAFMAGSPRSIGPLGRLGFHQGSFPGISKVVAAVIGRVTAREMVREGIDPAFAAKTAMVPAEKLWLPDQQELLRSHVATALVDGSAFSAAATGTLPTAQDADRSFSRNPAFAALKRVRPDAFAQAVQIFMTGITKGDSLGNIGQTTRAALVATVAYYRPTAGDILQVQFARLNADAARALVDMPGACMAMVYGDAVSKTYYYGHLPAPLRIRTDAVYGAIIDAGAQPQANAAMTRQEYNAEIRQLAMALQVQGLDLATLNSRPADDAQQRVACTTFAAFMDGVAALPADRAGKLMRYLVHPE